MTWLRRSLIGMMLVLSSLVPLVRATAAQDTLAPADLSDVTLQPNGCAFLVQGDDDPRERLGDIACGTLDVPENWSSLEGRRIQIGYLVLKSTAAQPMPDPVVFLAGGPGSSPLTSAEVWSRFFAGLREDRDVVFFDQRGTRLSSPLRCEAYTRMMALSLPPEVDPSAGELATTSYPADLTDPDVILQKARDQYGPAALACAQQLTREGVDLTQYTSIASANDAVALVKALGYDEYNLYGISYGTRLALEVMRNHDGSGLRSVVLDSTYPPEVRTYEQLAVSTHEVALRLFSDCERDPTCNAAFPDLKQRFVTLLTQLRASPVIAGDGTAITDRDLINIMHSLTGRVEIVPYVPLLLSELERGDDTTYRGIMSGTLFMPAPVPAEPGATPQPAGESGVSPDIETLQDLSSARNFVLALHTQLATQADQDLDQVTQSLLELDAKAHDRSSLREVIDGAFPGPEHKETRATFRSAIDAMSDSEIEAVYAGIVRAITLDDSRIAGQTVAQYYSIECNERMPFQSFADTVANTQRLEIPDLALGKPESLAKVFAICEQWPSGQAPDVEHDPVASEVPTLILAGAYDNLTPITWNKSAFVNLPNAVFVIAPMSGHAAITYSTCAGQIAHAFMADPVAPPDTTCFVDLQPQWVLPPTS